MSIIPNKRSIMTLYTSQNDMYSHQVRIVLAEKGVAVDYVSLREGEIPEDLADLNPYNTLPTLCDRDLVLYQSRIIMEYLDERFPHPPLLPIYPVARARARLMMYRIEKEWYGLANEILADPNGKDMDAKRKELQQSILNLSKMFSQSQYFMGDEFTLIDCWVAPLFWRLSDMGVKLTGAKAKPIMQYMDRVFNRDAFQASLTEVELELADAFILD
ncbi:MAG: glutathione S-transferase N-terminal domain-containing protein [Gammaproteobacteria bacterium]